jgi:NADPH:quinone reductase-like Zn-dependent oxidoreductase
MATFRVLQTPVTFAPFVQQHVDILMADLDQRDLGVLRDLLASGKLTPVIDRTYPLSEVPAAMAYLEQGHARGKVVIQVQ